MIFPKRKKPIKAESGLSSAMMTGIGMIPGAGAITAGLGVGKALGTAIEGDGSDAGKNALAGLVNPLGMVDSIAQGRIGEAIPVLGGIMKAKRIQGEQDKARMKQQAVDQDRLIAEGNQAFGQITYRDGGEVVDKRPDGEEPVQKHAVVLGGRLHKDGGNDVVDAATGEKVAETEVEELMFTKDQTSKIESHIAKYEQTKDQYCLLDLGSLVKDIVENQMKDLSGKYS